MRKCLARALPWGLLALAGNAAGQGAAYEDVRPVFEKRCAGCHWPGTDKIERSKLDLSTRATLLAGGKNGEAIIPGNAQESPLVQMIEYRLDPEMPPKKDADPLPAEEIALIRQWIDGGALGAEGDVAAPVSDAEAVIAADETGMPPTLLDAAIVDATPVTALAWSPDGAYLAEGRLQTVVIRNGESGAEMARLPGHAEQIRALAFSPDGALLAAGGGVPSESGEVVVWRTADWSRAATLGEHRDSVLAAAFSPDGKHLGTASYDKTVRVWSTENWETVHSFAEHVDAVYALAWSPDSATLATGAGDRTVKLWDVAEGQRLLTLSDATDAVHALAYAPDGRHLAAGAADKMIYVWDVAKSGADFSQSALRSGVLEHSTFAHEDAVLALAYSPTADKLYSAAQDGRVKAWDAATMSEATVFERQPDWALALAVHPDGGRIAVGRYDAAAPIYDTATGARLDAAPAMQVASNNEQDVQKAGGERAAELDVDAVIINATVPPSLRSLSPNRAARGAEIEMWLNGKNLTDAEVFCNNAAIQVALLENEAKEFPEFRYDRNSTGAQIFDYARPHTLKVRVTVPADAHPGRYELFARTPHGLTNGEAFDVAPWPDMPEEASEDSPQPITLPATVAGKIDEAWQHDRFAVALEAGEELVAVLADAQVAARLAVLNTEGEAITEGVFEDGNRVAFRAPDAGTYLLEVAASEQKTGSYRLHVGPFPWVTWVDARGVIAGKENAVRVEGFNLGTDAFTLTPAADMRAGEMVPLPVPGFAGNPIEAPRIPVGHDPELAEAEPNDAASNAQALDWPATVNASLSAGESDVFKFATKAGETVVLEVAAARLGARLDTVLEILDTRGEPLLRAKARCVAQTKLTLSDRDSFTAGLRIEDWSALAINDYLMVGSEVLRVLGLPDYADEDLVVHDSSTGQRQAFFGTTPEYHAVGEAVYKVEIHPPDATFAPNGMPVFPLYWRNDDHIYHDATRGDPRIDFVAPEDGEYLVRVSDAIPREEGEEWYRLHVRPLRPDFDVFVGPGRLNIAAGGRVPLDVTIRRYDDFSPPVDITAESLPAGISVIGETVPAGDESTRFALTAGPDADTLPWEERIRFSATAHMGGEMVTRETWLDHVEIVNTQPDIEVFADTDEIVLRPGQTQRVHVRLERHNGFTSRVPLEAINLPFGVRILDTGLNGILVREGETERSMEIYVEPWVEPVRSTVFAQARIESPSPGRMLFLSAPITFRVESAATQVAEDGTPTEAD